MTVQNTVHLLWINLHKLSNLWSSFWNSYHIHGYLSGNQSVQHRAANWTVLEGEKGSVFHRVNTGCKVALASTQCRGQEMWSYAFAPVSITLEAHSPNQEKLPSLSNRHTHWDDFIELINERLTLNASLKIEEILKQQPSSSTIQRNGRVGTQCQNIQTHSRHTIVLH
jgi:hypothetical protein